jgi:hypothetical protein
MSCATCEWAQQPNKKSLTGVNQASYVRSGNGNVMFSGCKEHVEQLFGKALTWVKATPKAVIK